MLLHFDNGNVYCTSRRYSKKTGRFMENQEKLPKLKPLAEKLKRFGYDYTVLDCECYANDWSTVVGILHSLPLRAIELQKLVDVKFAVFDCIWYKGKYIGDAPYQDRLLLVKSILQIFNHSFIHFVKTFSNNALEDDVYGKTFGKYDYNEIQKIMNTSINLGYEGIVIKPTNSKYYDKAACLKVKKFETVDVVVCGYQLGNGKYSNTIGALEVGYYDESSNKIVKISKVNCGTDEDRDYWRDNWTSLMNSVIEVKCQEITEKSLRHPVYIRRRPDKNYMMCTKDTIFKES